MESGMKTNRCVWKVVLALFIAATFSLFTIGCSEKGGKQSKPEQPDKKQGSDTKKPKKSEHPE